MQFLLPQQVSLARGAGTFGHWDTAIEKNYANAGPKRLGGTKVDHRGNYQEDTRTKEKKETLLVPLCSVLAMCRQRRCSVWMVPRSLVSCSDYLTVSDYRHPVRNTLTLKTYLNQGTDTRSARVYLRVLIHPIEDSFSRSSEERRRNARGCCY